MKANKRKEVLGVPRNNAQQPQHLKDILPSVLEKIKRNNHPYCDVGTIKNIAKTNKTENKHNTDVGGWSYE